ncbi:flagellar biosynthetic protein FliR [Timonella sp. A28]|uniref:flagellar biosynthetic protein FliR n=1 Tax=Timonella sp. A28 TaxID=3442640 RepID=UPI003EB770A8
MTLALSLPAIQTLMLVSVRLIAFMIVAPPFSYRAFPGTVRMMIALGVALAIYSGSMIEVRSFDTGPYVLAIILEAFVGFALGFLVYLVFQAVSTAGSLLDQMGGFAMAASFDPMNFTQNTPMGRLFQMTTLVLLFASNGHLIILSGLMKTFHAIPLGSGVPVASLGSTATEQFGQMFVAAVQIAGPLLIVLLLADVGLGLLTRVAPALNAFAMGFPLKIYLTLALGSLTYLTLPNATETLLKDGMRAIFGVVT